MSALAIARAVGGLFGGVVKFVRDHPWQCAFAVALWLAWSQSNRADQWQTHSLTEAANHRQTKENYRAAQAEAKAKAVAVRIETERRYAALAKEADDANDNADRWRDAARRYSDAGGLRVYGGAGAGSPGGGARAIGADRAPSGDDGPGQASVVLSRADFDTLTENTGRLLILHDLGASWIAEGFAVPLAH